MYGRFTLYTNVRYQIGVTKKSCYYVIFRHKKGIQLPSYTYSFFTIHKPWSKDPESNKETSNFTLFSVLFSLCWSKSLNAPAVLQVNLFPPFLLALWVHRLGPCRLRWGFLQPEKMGAKTSHRGCPMVNVSFDQCLIYLPLYIYIILMVDFVW